VPQKHEPNRLLSSAWAKVSEACATLTFRLPPHPVRSRLPLPIFPFPRSCLDQQHATHFFKKCKKTLTLADGLVPFPTASSLCHTLVAFYHQAHRIPPGHIRSPLPPRPPGDAPRPRQGPHRHSHPLAHLRPHPLPLSRPPPHDGACQARAIPEPRHRCRFHDLGGLFRVLGLMSSV